MSEGSVDVGEGVDVEGMMLNTIGDHTEENVDKALSDKTRILH